MVIENKKNPQKTPHLPLEGNTFFFDLIDINTQQKASMILKKQILPKQHNIINNIQIKTKYRINNKQIIKYNNTAFLTFLLKKGFELLKSLGISKDGIM